MYFISTSTSGGYKMTTPQNQLYNLADKVQRLSDLFEENEDGESIFDSIKQMELEIADVMASQQRLENLMNLIVKVLSKRDI